MKTFNHLYEKVIDPEILKMAVHKVCVGRKKRKYLDQYCQNEEETAKKAYNWVINYEPIQHKPKEIYDGISRKKRIIIVPTFEELTIQHAVVAAMKPVFYQGMYEHTYAAIPGRGVHKAKKFIEKWIRNDPNNTKYVLKMDIHHFFDSIQHGLLKYKLYKKIHDCKLLDLLYKIIDTTEKGLPLGFYTSQWLANWLLQDLDHYIKEVLGAKYYIRYQDDMVIFGSNKTILHLMRFKIKMFLKQELELDLKKNWQVFLFSFKGEKDKDCGRDLDFIGFRFFHNRVILRKKIMLKAIRKVNHIKKRKRLTVHDSRQILSYLGWINATDTYQMYLDRVKPFIKIKKCKEKVSKYDKMLSLMKGGIENEYSLQAA